MFACAHPAIDEGVRAPLILQTCSARCRDDRLGVPRRAAAMGSAGAREEPASQAGIRSACRARGARSGGWVLDAHHAVSPGWTDPAGTQPSLSHLAEEGIWLGRLGVAAAAGAERWLLSSCCTPTRAAMRARRAGRVVPPAGTENRDGGALALHRRSEELLLRAAAWAAGPPVEAAVPIGACGAPPRRQNRLAAIVSYIDALLQMTGSVVVAINPRRRLRAARAERGLAAARRAAGRCAPRAIQPYGRARRAYCARGQSAAAARPISAPSDWSRIRRCGLLQRALLELHDVEHHRGLATFFGCKLDRLHDSHLPGLHSIVSVWPSAVDALQRPAIARTTASPMSRRPCLAPGLYSPPYTFTLSFPDLVSDTARPLLRLVLRERERAAA